jgi:hypothetical protein
LVLNAKHPSVDEIVYRLWRVCAQHADFLQEMYTLSGRRVDQARGRFHRAQNESKRYLRLLPRVIEVRKQEPSASTAAVAKKVIGGLSPSAWDQFTTRKIHHKTVAVPRSRTSEAHQAKKLAEWLRANRVLVESYRKTIQSGEIDGITHYTYSDHRIKGRENSPMMLDILRRQHEEIVASLEPRPARASTVNTTGHRRG